MTEPVKSDAGEQNKMRWRGGDHYQADQEVKHSATCSIYLPLDRTCDCGAIRIRSVTTDPTVEALKELREMFPGKESSVEFDTKGRVLITVFDGTVPHFDYHSTLSECMAQVRAHFQEQEKGEQS